MSRFVTAAAVIVASTLAVVDGWPEWGVGQGSGTVALKMGDDDGVIALKMGDDDGMIALKMGDGDGEIVA